MSRTEEVLKHGSFGKLLLNLSLPSVLIIIIMLIYNIADTYFIGQTGNPKMIYSHFFEHAGFYCIIRNRNSVWQRRNNLYFHCAWRGQSGESAEDHHILFFWLCYSSDAFFS